MTYPWHLYFMGFLYVLAGSLHFVFPKTYLRIMPRFLPYPKALVFWSGLAEIALGIALCVPITKDWSIYGILAMLTIFLVVHFNMLRGEKEAAGIPKWILVLRLPLQILLMYWAYEYLAL